MSCAAAASWVASALGFSCWFCRRAELAGADQSQGWPEAKVEELLDFRRTSILILAAYEDDLETPTPDFPDEGKELLKRVTVVRKACYADTKDKCPPYIITVDHNVKDITLAVRGLNLNKVNEYFTLLDNKEGKQKFNDGFVHNGMLRSAGYLLDEEMGTLNSLMLEYKDYTLTLAGHSLGSGVVCLMTLILLQKLEELKGVTRNRIRCHCFAPARCVSLNIAVSSADVVNSIILQDDFLPRMNYPLETILGSWFCLPCILQWACCVDFFLPPEKLIKDPRRLYPPGRLFHVLYTAGGKCHVAIEDPEAKVDIPVDGRFEKLIISRTTHADHLLTTIHAQLSRLMTAMKDQEEDFMAAPQAQKIERLMSCQKAKMESLVQAMERAQTLRVPNAFDPESARLDEGELMHTEVLGPEISEGSLEEATPVPVSSDQFRSGGLGTTKWSNIIDDIIASEGSKQARSDPAPQRKWSIVRRAIKENKITQDNDDVEITMT